MHLIRGATLTVADIARSETLYCETLAYTCIERGEISVDLAQSWGAPKTAGQPYAVLQPASGRDVFIRLIQQPAVPDYTALTSYGWAAIEICNQDTLAVNKIMEASAFDIIGPPKQLDGMPAIFPMQVKGPDQEIVYLTEIRDNMPDYDLPRAESFIDHLFILVMACSDMEATGAWLEKHMLIEKGRSLEIIYSMINNAFDLPPETKHALATLKHGDDVFLEIDRYPDAATPRPAQADMLAPCVAIGSFVHPDFEGLMGVNADHWLVPPALRAGVMYQGKRVGVLRDPDGTLIEMIEA